MVVQTARQINEAFDLVCPELQSKYGRFPMKFDKWRYDFDGKYEDGKPIYIAAATDQDGVKLDYVFCKNGPLGKGYYHLCTKVAHVNLAGRFMSSTGPGGHSWCGGGAGSTAAERDAWDTTKRILYARSRCNKPDDDAAKEQGIDHMVGTELNPVHGLKL